MKAVGIPQPSFAHMIDVLAYIDRRLYSRDQSVASLDQLVNLVRLYEPTVIVELGTLAGLSLRAWVQAGGEARIHAIDTSFAKLQETRKYFPFDEARIQYHACDILTVDFSTLWKTVDRVLLFVDAHDRPMVPIMRHVLDCALPLLPLKSLVVVDDVWRAKEALNTPASVSQFFLDVMLGDLDELQCFEGHYASYHAGGAFAGFREVVPLLEFVNSRGIPLHYRPNVKSVWFEWNQKQSGQTGEGARAVSKPLLAGSFTYHPLDFRPLSGQVETAFPALAGAYRRRDFKAALEWLNDCHQGSTSERQGMEAVIEAARGALPEALAKARAAGVREAGWRVGRLARALEKRCGRKGFPEKTTPREFGLTLFAIPKAFVGHIGLIQRNAIRSWRRLSPDLEILLFGDEPGTAETAAEVGARHLPECARNERGTPLVNDLFARANEQASFACLAYVNADIVLFNDFLAAVRSVKRQRKEFLIIGQRWDLHLSEAIDFGDPGWAEQLVSDCRANGFLHGESGMDYFVHTLHFWPPIPPFAIGRCAWDNWLVILPVLNGQCVIDATETILAIHQEHDYGHLPGDRAEAFGGVETARNRALLHRPTGILGYVSDASLEMDRQGCLTSKPKKPNRCATAEFRAERSAWLSHHAQANSRRSNEL